MKFDVPVRIRWDVDPPSPFLGEALPIKITSRIFDGILEASPLTLDITVESAEALGEISVLLARLEEPIMISLYLSESVESVDKTEKNVHLSSFKTLFHGNNLGRTSGEFFWFSPDPRDYRDTFEVVERFLASRGKLLVLRNPNVRKKGISGKIPVPGFENVRNKGDIRKGLKDKEKTIVIHDYFLWKYFRDTMPGFIDERAEFDGCQGGSTLAYVDWEGRIYPCETLLVPLGKVPEDKIRDIWNSSERKHLADRIRESPTDCIDCAELEGCFGGCRGLAYHFSEGLEDPDPQCDR